MSQFKRNSEQKRTEEVNQRVDYLADQPDWTAITQQWMLKSERYSNDETIPPAPIPPNISYLCYFNEHAENQVGVNMDSERNPQLPSEKTTNSGQQRNDWQPLIPVKIEPDQESGARRNLSLRYDLRNENPDNGLNASRSESSSKGDHISQPLNPVKIEPEEESVSSTNSNLSYDAHADNARQQVNASCRLSRDHQQELNSLKIEPESVTPTLLRNKKSSVGYNVYIENPRNGILASSYQSISNSDYTDYWLPILSCIEVWPYIKNEFLSSIDRLCAGIDFFGSGPEKVFKVCASLMNSAVVKIMKNGRNEAAYNAYINGFFSIYRLLSQYAQDVPDLIELSNRALTNFMASSAARAKRAVPNLGEFLMHLTISKKWTWLQISNAFMDELDARNVFWYCVGNQNSPPAYPELINVQNYSHDREAKVFHATTLSRNLVMFQVKFAAMTKSMEFTEFCSNFGRVQDILTTKLKDLFSTVVAIKNWDQFYDFLQMPRVTSVKRNNDLARAVTRSALQGYHKRNAKALRATTKRAKRWPNSRKSFPY